MTPDMPDKPDILELYNMSGRTNSRTKPGQMPDKPDTKVSSDRIILVPLFRGAKCPGGNPMSGLVQSSLRLATYEAAQRFA